MQKGYAPTPAKSKSKKSVKKGYKHPDKESVAEDKSEPKGFEKKEK